MIAPVNRIPDLLADEDISTEAPAARSPAQQAASRRNGALGRGPVTAAGKARSAMNSMKHGLLARLISPPADIRGQHRLYSEIRAALIAEMHPQTFTQYITVDLLARDYLQLARLGAMSEVLQQIALPADEEKGWTQLRQNQRSLKALEQAIARLAGGRKLDCPPDAAQFLAAEVRASIRGLEEYLNPPEEDRIPEEQLDDDDRQELREVQEQWNQVLPVKDRLVDTQYVASVLRGRAQASAAEREQLVAILTRSRNPMRWRLEQSRPAAQRAESRLQQSVASLAADPQRLMLLERYRARLERAISKKLKQLGR